jgi:hypothetical protein
MVDKRREQRFDTDVNVISSDKEGLIFGFVRNLSKGGAFIEMRKSLPIGMPFSFTLAHENVQTKVFGRVIRIDSDPKTGITKVWPSNSPISKVTIVLFGMIYCSTQ